MRINNFLASGMRHSCYPNAIYSIENKIVVIKSISPGEPITIDFSTQLSGFETFFKCNCGYNGCRKEIKGFECLPVSIQDYYLKLGAVSEEFFQHIDRE